MQDASWQGNNEGMLPNGAELPGSRNPHFGQGLRSQDDAKVAYFFQRPTADSNSHHNQNPRRWAAGDDSTLEQLQVNTMNEHQWQLAGII